MGAVLKLACPIHQPEPELDGDMRVLLNTLRFHAATCRAKARVDFFHACLLIDPKAEATDTARLEMVLRVMGDALGNTPIFFRPGEPELSFDERWLIAVISARIQDDSDSFEFLMRRRVSHDKRRLFGALIAGLADQIS